MDKLTVRPRSSTSHSELSTVRTGLSGHQRNKNRKTATSGQVAEFVMDWCEDSWRLLALAQDVPTRVSGPSIATRGRYITNSALKTQCGPGRIFLIPALRAPRPSTGRSGPPIWHHACHQCGLIVRPQVAKSLATSERQHGSRSRGFQCAGSYLPQAAVGSVQG